MVAEMSLEPEFYHPGPDGARYTVDVVRDRRDEANPHYDVDLVRSQTGRFGETLEQRLTLAEFDGPEAARLHQIETERTLSEQGLPGLGDAADRIRREPVLYDGTYLFVTYPPEAAGTDRSAAWLLHLAGDGLESERLAVGLAQDMAAVVAAGEQAWAAGELPSPLPDSERHPIGATGFTRDASMTIHDATDRAWTSHLDGGDTSHWFALVATPPEAPDPYELRYFRALADGAGEFKHDSYPVMPLPDDDPGSAWALPGLAMYLERGDVFMAQQFAHDVAEDHGLDFPSPLALPALDPEPDYYFGYGTGPGNRPALEAVKTWLDGAERRFDTFTIAEYSMYEEAQMDEQELDNLMHDSGVEAAMNVAEQMAVAGGYLDPQRDDGRMFFAEDAPPDPFTTVRERELATPDAALYADWLADREHTIAENAALTGADWFEATFNTPARALLGPVDDTVNYAVVVRDADPETVELAVEKHWRGADDAPESAFVSVRTYDPEDRPTAEADRQGLLDLHAERGLEALMHRVELDALGDDRLDLFRNDTRLFTDGPPDRFETLAARMEHEVNPYWNLSDRVDDAPAPGSWDELVAQQPDPAPEADRHYWQMHYRPVETPTGEPLGTALFVTEFPQLPPDFDAQVEANGMDDSVYPTQARTLEMAHFPTEAAARKFETDFRSYLIPDLIDGPDLAPEVAKLEGLSGEWQDLDQRDIVDYMSGSRAIVREASDWHPYNPHAERETPVPDLDL